MEIYRSETLEQAFIAGVKYCEDVKFGNGAYHAPSFIEWKTNHKMSAMQDDHIFARVKGKASLPIIQRAVALSNFIHEQDMQDYQGRNRLITSARHMAYMFAFLYANDTVQTIGNTWGGRDHSTVSVCAMRFAEKIPFDPMLKSTTSVALSYIREHLFVGAPMMPICVDDSDGKVYRYRMNTSLKIYQNLLKADIITQKDMYYLKTGL